MGAGAKVAKINVDDNQALGPRFGIRGIPTILVFKNGQVVEQLRPSKSMASQVLRYSG